MLVLIDVWSLKKAELGGKEMQNLNVEVYCWTRAV